jgi:hypothetical protein
MKLRTRSCQSLFGAAAILHCCAAMPIASADPPSYSVQFITPGLSAVSAAAMNEAGDVVGRSTTGSGGWVSYAGAPAVFLPLPPPGYESD